MEHVKSIIICVRSVNHGTEHVYQSSTGKFSSFLFHNCEASTLIALGLGSILREQLALHCLTLYICMLLHCNCFGHAHIAQLYIFIYYDSGTISSALQMTAFQAFMVSIVSTLMKQRALCQPLKLSRQQHKLQLKLPRNQ